MYFLNKVKFQDSSSVILSMMILMTVVIGIYFFSSDEYTLDLKEEVFIETLKDNNQVNGDFTLGHGSIDEDTYYQYMRKLDNGGFKSEKIIASDATIFYLEGNAGPSVKVYSKIYKSKIRKFISPSLKEYHFYIPKGSIENNYKIDAE